VRNTFIHTGPLPSTPLGGAQRRSRSAPRDLGSSKDHWEVACHTLGYLLSRVDDPIVGDGSSTPFSDEGTSTACSVSVAQAGENDLTDTSSESGLEPPRKAKFCPDEPLNLEDAGVFLTPCFAPSTSKRLAPAVEKADVRNTFIHVAGPLPSPLPGASRHRSRSLSSIPMYLSSPTCEKSQAASPIEQACMIDALFSPAVTASPVTPYHTSKLASLRYESAQCPFLRLAEHV